MQMLKLTLFLLLQLSAADIMKRVGENQDREQKERANFLYEEKIHVVTRRTNGKLAREEWTTSSILPSSKGLEKKRQEIHGRYWRKGQYIDFRGEPVPEAGSLDGGLISGFRDDLTDEKTKDGIGQDLYPLATEEQKAYRFELAGEQVVDGRPAYRIRYGPVDKSDLTWAGEALIDKDEFQPVTIYSRFSRRLPFFVRAMLGTDLPGFGFNTRYARVEKDVWFPVSFSTEFRLHAVFFINRNIILSMEAKNFHRTSADSHVTFDDAPH